MAKKRNTRINNTNSLFNDTNKAHLLISLTSTLIELKKTDRNKL